MITIHKYFQKSRATHSASLDPVVRNCQIYHPNCLKAAKRFIQFMYLYASMDQPQYLDHKFALPCGRNVIKM